MGILEEELEALTKQVAEAEKAESEPEKAVVEEPEEETEVADTEEAGDDETEPADKPEVKEEKPVEKTEDLDASGYARLRRENAALKRQLAEAVPVVASPVVAPVAQAPVIAAEPDKAKDPVAWFTWRDQQREQEIKELKTWRETVSQQTAEVQLETEAVKEFKAIEAEFKATAPDFDNVADHLNKRLFQSISDINPHLAPEQVMGMVKDKVLTMAGAYIRQGLNPVEELYHLSKERYGYTAPVADDAEEAPANKPDLNKVAANRKRNAGTAAAKGAGSMPGVTRALAAEMSVSEWAALPKAEKDRLLRAD